MKYYYSKSHRFSTQQIKVIGAALENAASVSGMLLTTECVITEVKSAEPAMPMGGGMPGMM
ncbi:hypothetical protein [Chryseobacterium gleum]|uniref:Chaperonin GroEL n=1 Tax=Chryseobacterium gleum ATCC 35910 TaxID=525257 RepID=A0ABN0ATC5_CHRGE|nr:hypothetical protein [Chryseobacterium gleum]EFK36358.1 hypothetical protein HMPREF0204_11805 [Chryseobacterium gleum ATCC 35910]MCD9617249.1 hypothetical protein [Chryseobacterium gleum]QQY34831.1 hypothetical protein I6I60_07485 [Chryseobacterium gleum]